MNPSLTASRVLALQMAFHSSLQSHEGGRARVITFTLKMEKPSILEACNLHKIQKTLNRCPAQTFAFAFLGEGSSHPKSLLLPLGLHLHNRKISELKATAEIHLPHSVVFQEGKPRHSSSSARLSFQVPAESGSAGPPAA